MVPSPIVVTESGNVSDVRMVRLENALILTVFTVEGIVNSVMLQLPGNCIRVSIFLS